MKDQNDENEFLDDQDIPNDDSAATENLDEFDQEDLSQFDDIHEEYDDSEGHDDGLTDQESDEPLPEDEAYANLDESTAAKANKQGGSLINLIKDNWLYISLGLIVLIVAGYLLMGTLSSGSAPAARPAPAPAATQNGFNSLPAAQQQSAANNASATNTAATSTQTNANATPVGTPTTISMTSDQMQQLLQGFSSSVQDSMKSIETTLQNSGGPATNQKLADLQQQLSTLNANLSTADVRLQTTQQQLSQVLAQESANQQKLTLRATVPGRAWLVDAQGNTISVVVGSNLGYIGTVTEIDSDPNNSQVVTSSGYIFK